MSDRAPVHEMQDIDITELHPDPKNAKVHTEAQVEQIIASIRANGFADPIAVVPRRRGGGYTIVEGHGRYEAACQIGMATVPCLILEPMTEAERRAYAIAHNQTQTLTGLDMGIVANEFDRLGVVEEDYMSVGFSSEDVLFLLPDPSDPPTATEGEETEDGDDETETPPGSAPQTYDPSSWSGSAPTVHKLTLRFDSEADQLAFYALIRQFRSRYLHAATVGERFRLFAEEFPATTEGGE